MIYGNARLSHKDQNLDTQLETLSKFGVDQVVSGVQPTFRKFCTLSTSQ
ncbi:MAG: hypothetical protein ACQEWW_08620 [Bacillota bacterium]